MTLALYGKSKRRQGGLLLVGLLAIVVALLGALVLNGAPAKAATTSGFAGTAFQIGTDTQWTNASNATGNNQGTFATRTGSMQRQGYRDFNLSVPAGSTINGITVQVYGFSTPNSQCQLEVGLYSSPTGNFGTAVVKQVATPSSAGTMTFGASNDLWGRTWTPDNFANSDTGSFRMYIRNFDDNTNCRTSDAPLDTWSVATIQVIVDYTPPPDDDGDGVPNSADQCPGTPGATTVDPLGCSFQQYLDKVGTGGKNPAFAANVCQEANFSFVVDRSGSI
ncbi:MAG TPA: hypothetical protein PJ994_04675, partial [Tepidiformaceae bacterium]|nr:hypothetical protein [Tepidiformaceae bacterium]